MNDPIQRDSQTDALGVSNMDIAASCQCSRNTVTNTDTGETIPAYLFVASLPYSGYAYVEAFLSMNQEAWMEMGQSAAGAAAICHQVSRVPAYLRRNSLTHNVPYTPYSSHYPIHN